MKGSGPKHRCLIGIGDLLGCVEILAEASENWGWIFCPTPGADPIVTFSAEELHSTLFWIRRLREELR
jgi:hypothetical protein